MKVRSIMHRAPIGGALLAATAIFCGACDDPGASEPGGQVAFRDSPCDQENVESYYDNFGEEIICGGNSDAPGWPPDPPDFCTLYPRALLSTARRPAARPLGRRRGPPGPTCTALELSEIPADFQAQVNQRVDDCFTKNWSTTAFVEKTDTSKYAPAQGALYGIADWIFDAISACIQNYDWLFYSGTSGSQVLQGLVDRLNTQATAQNLAPHQRICSAMCVSSRLITYAESNLSNSLPSNATTSGVGVCREFAQIGERLLDGMGFTSSTVGSLAEHHAFVEVTSPAGGTFYVEPQPSSCEFYNRH